MDVLPHSLLNSAYGISVEAGQDRFSTHRGLGISYIDFKVTPQEGNDILILENTFEAKGGPPRHLHVNQDEWFYVIEGKFIFEVGDERICLERGDSLLARRRVPHVWANVSDMRSKILITFTPAGDMEAFFRKVTAANAMPPQNQELFRSHGMELLGPPLSVE